jgi:hypothetical protein
MARNNRELSQLAAFIGIEDHSQEIDAGSSYQFAQVVAIGASLYAGTEESPAVGIGTTDIVRAFQVASRDGTLFSKVQSAEGTPVGGGIEVEGDAIVEGIGSFGGTVSAKQGIYEDAYSETLGLEVPLREAQFGGHITVNTNVQGDVGIGTTQIQIAVNNANIEIGSTGGIVNSGLPVYISAGYVLDGETINVPAALDVQGGKTNIQGPVRIDAGGFTTSLTIPTSSSEGLVAIAGGVGVAGTIYHDNGDLRTDSIIINPSGSIFLDSDTTTLQVKSFADFSEAATELGAISQASGNIATFSSNIYLSNGAHPSGFDTIGQNGIAALQIDGGAIIGETLYVTKEIQTLAFASCRDFTVDAGGAQGITQISTPQINIGDGIEILGVSTHVTRLNTQIDSAIIPFENALYNLGDTSYYWSSLFVDEIFTNTVAINTEATIANLTVSGIGTFTDQFYHSGVPGTAIFFNGVDLQNQSTIDTVTIRQTTAIEDILGTATTSLRAKAIDVGTAVTDNYYNVLLTDTSGGTLENSVFADGGQDSNGEVGLRFNPVNDTLDIGGNLYVNGADTDNIVIGMDPNLLSSINLKFFEDGVNTVEMFSNDQRSLSIGSTLGVSTINSYRHSVRGDLLLGALGVGTAAIKSVGGLENITITGNTLTEISGDIAMEGSTFDVRNALFNLGNSNSTTVNAFRLADTITIGATAGFTSFRSPLVRFEGDIRVDGNAIQASDGQENIIMTGAELTRFSGDIQVDGTDILVAGGVTNITMNTNLNTIFSGDIQVGGNEIRDSEGDLTITLGGSGLVSVASTLKVEGNTIQSGAGVTNITLSTGYTQIEADLRVNGDNIRASDNAVNITMNGSTNTTVAGDLTVGSNSINAADTIEAITLVNGTGAVGIVSDLTANGNLYVRGDITNILSENLNLRDKLVDIGLSISTTTNTDLVAPSSDENKDLGLLLNYYTTSAKKAAVFWDDSDGSIGIASDVSETSQVLSINEYARIVAKSITISDCAGTSDIIECEGSTRTLANITIDGGEY